jgi:SAM-dependent methyltransferase
MPLITPNIQYYGIDISIPEPAPNLIEADFLENPIALGGMRFDVVLAQGVFEYMGSFQSQKFSEIAGILKEHGRFVVSYVNFGHRDRDIYFPYNNVQPLNDFRTGLESYFKVDRFFPTSHNWKHSEPNRKILQDLNMDLNVNIPIISPKLAVEYFFI